MADVFISYSRRDGGLVRELHDFLMGDGCDVWGDWEDIPPAVMRRLSVTVLVVGAALALAACASGSSRSKTHTLAATKKCLKAQRSVAAAAPESTNIFHINKKPIGGVLEVELKTGNSADLGFYRTNEGANNGFSNDKKIASRYGFEATPRKDLTKGNVVVYWTSEPTSTEMHAVEGCLRP